MLVTIEEAKTKRCSRNKNFNCCSTQCMSWRWYDSEDDYAPQNIRDRRGYCGLAGKIKEE
jgi:hypothetical protein